MNNLFSKIFFYKIKNILYFLFYQIFIYIKEDYFKKFMTFI